jgi:hypothetical protein
MFSVRENFWDNCDLPLALEKQYFRNMAEPAARKLRLVFQRGPSRHFLIASFKVTPASLRGLVSYSTGQLSADARRAIAEADGSRNRRDNAAGMMTATASMAGSWCLGIQSAGGRRCARIARARM